ncbi:MAG: D-aminoacyl-tRNA deacylase [Pyrinomonadaceae bacterium]
MRAVIQRVSRAQVSAGDETVGAIGRGLLVLLGVSANDSEADAVYLSEKTVNLRIFEGDDNKTMDRSLLDIHGDLLVVSQFTLYGDTRRGRRPSYIKAARPDHANSLYEFFVDDIKSRGINVATGRFQAMMNVELVNDGPVTILLDSERTI